MLALVAVKEVIFPVPEAPRPIPTVLFVQAYEVPVPPKAMACVDVLLHTTWLVRAFKVGVGFTVMVNDCGNPGQLAFPPAKFGVIVTVPEIGTCPALVVVNAAIFPLPVAPKPIEVLLLLQEYEVPLPEKFTA